jgi:hypothetical protein
VKQYACRSTNSRSSNDSCVSTVQAKDAATDDDVEALLIAAVFHLAIGRSDEAETLFARAALKDAAAVKVAKAELAPH